METELKPNRYYIKEDKMNTKTAHVDIKVWLLNEKNTPIDLDIDTIGVLLGKPNICDVNPSKPAYATLRYSSLAAVKQLFDEDLTWLKNILNQRKEAIERGF